MDEREVSRGLGKLWSPGRWVVMSMVVGCGGGGSADSTATGSTGETMSSTTIPVGESGEATGGSSGLDADSGSDSANTTGSGGVETDDPWACGPALGARRFSDGAVEVRVEALRATRIEVAFFSEVLGQADALRLPMEQVDGRWQLRVEAEALAEAELSGDLYYGLRVWGPNWEYDEAWAPGSELGRVADVDDRGNRMNPNKLLLDPYALEQSHDPVNPEQLDWSVFRTDEDNRLRDSGPSAPKGVVIECASVDPGPTRAFRDEVVYEVHLRGLTMSDPTVPEAERGTYAGAGRKAAQLSALGVTAIEFLPLHETPNDQNELSPDASGDNYWGYSTLSYFAPDRRYAADRSAGGPTRELRAMVEAFHAEGIKVYLDAVYNHTSEGGASGGAATIFSLRGLDNALFYVLGNEPDEYINSNGVGPDVNTSEPMVADLVVASLRYWHEQLGFDGYRFDLASVMANGCSAGCYSYDPALPERIATELGRDADGGEGVDLIAEPWGAVGGTYQVGNFPVGWSEWNDQYRDTMRRDLNRLGVETVTLRTFARRISGSPDIYEATGRPPAASVNFVIAHDGFTLHDLFRYNDRDNDQPWPYGPSDGGSTYNLAWDHGGDPVQQATATRTATALLAVSAGVPMVNGGDEYGRSLRANNNPYNLDSEANWLRWPGDPEYDEVLAEFNTRLWAFRAAHAALRPASSWEAFGDGDGDGLTQVRWFQDDGNFVDDGYLDSDSNHFIAWQLDGDELGDTSASIYFAYNGWEGSILAALPAPPPGTSWIRAIDTSEQGEDFGYVEDNGPVIEGSYWVAPRSLVALIAQ
ncbi:MAG: alpha-amylase family glycosyl hydrolase [Myxococcota bacterium]